MKLADFLPIALSFGLPKSDGYDAASFIAGISYEKAKSFHDLVLDDEKVAEVTKRWEKGEPTAYITGRREFFGREFMVNQSVLIPRVETEILVDAALKELNGRVGRILDLCSGSGCIILSVLAENRGVSGIGIDISPKALDIGRLNAENFGLSGRVGFIEADVCNFPGGELFDIITCNPPYVSETEYKALEKGVYYEPKIALTAKDDGLFFYKLVLSKMRSLCKSNGSAFFEIGSSQGAAVAGIAGSFGFKAEILKDLSGADRVIKTNL